MEKYSQFRDRATGIAPFFPLDPPLTTVSILTSIPIFLFKTFFFTIYFTLFFLLINWLPLPPIVRKMALWVLLFLPGMLWTDLQLDGVKRGGLANQPRERFPHPGSIIAANFTSPVDAIYLAAIFDPVFTVSYPNTRLVQKVGLLGAIMRALGSVHTVPPPDARLVSIKTLLKQYPGRVVAVFPECSTTNGKGILPLSPSLLHTPPDVLIFPVSIRYSHSDVTTPLPSRWMRFLWNLLSRFTTTIRVRVAEGQVNLTSAHTNGHIPPPGENREPLSVEEQKVLDRVGEALARLSRVKKVALTMDDKTAFITALTKKKA